MKQSDSNQVDSEIVTSRVSVYEIELDLSDWEYSQSSDAPGFYEKLSSTIESIKEHKCMPGRPGGFLEELRKGIDFAHVIEHVIIELIQLTSPTDQEYTGWTRRKGGKKFTIHYSAPDFLTGRLAAILGLELVKKLLNGDEIELNYYLNQLKNPKQYFTQEYDITESSSEKTEPFSVIQELEDEDVMLFDRKAIPILSQAQTKNIVAMLSRIKKHVNTISELWKNTFFDYSGNFGRTIVDKIELINIDKFMDLLIAGDFNSYFRAVKNMSSVMNSYRIPIHFIIHSIWIYKTNLFGFIIQDYENNKLSMQQFIHDFEEFFQVMIKNVADGFASSRHHDAIRQLRELKVFRELKKCKGEILIVDDDATSRSVIGDLLTFHGYLVDAAESGEQGLDILLKKADQISLVILDLMMPGMSGEDVYERISRDYPDLKVLISSGYPISTEQERLFASRNIMVLKKPFSANELINCVKMLCQYAM